MIVAFFLKAVVFSGGGRSGDWTNADGHTAQSSLETCKTHTSVNTCDDHRHFMSAVIPHSFEICDSLECLDVSRELDKNEYIVIIFFLCILSILTVETPIKAASKKNAMPQCLPRTIKEPEVAGYLWLRFEESSRKKVREFLRFTENLDLFQAIDPFVGLPTKASRYRMKRKNLEIIALNKEKSTVF